MSRTCQVKPRWEPSGFPGMAMWLDASMPGTMTFATGVSAWQSRGQDGRSITQATTTAQPLWSATAGGSTVPGVVFDGTDDVLTRNEAFMYAAGACVSFLVVTSAAPVTSRFVLSEGSSSSATPVYAPMRISTTTATTGVSLLTVDAGTNALGNSPVAGTSYNSTPTLLVRVDTGSNMAARKNGLLGNNSAYTRATTTLDRFALGARSKASPDNWAAITAHELIVVLGTMDTPSITLLEGYLGWKWGVTLDTAHPYYSTAP